MNSKSEITVAEAVGDPRTDTAHADVTYAYTAHANGTSGDSCRDRFQTQLCQAFESVKRCSVLRSFQSKAGSMTHLYMNQTRNAG